MSFFSWIGYRVGKLVELTELYSFKDGSKIFFSLYKKRKFYTVKTSFLKSPVYLRDNFSDKAIFQQVFTEQQYSPKLYKFPVIKTILDGGANIGLASIFFSNKFQDAQILAIEPEASNFQMLLKNTEKLDKIKCIQAAIWNRNENIAISNPESLAASFIVQKTDTSTNFLKGNTIDFFKKEMGWKNIDLVKLDIEGAEKEIFEGSTEWLSGVKLLIIELHDHYKSGCTKALFKALQNFDYECFFHHENIFIRFN